MQSTRRVVHRTAALLLLPLLLALSPVGSAAGEEHALSVGEVPTNLGLANQLTRGVATLAVNAFDGRFAGSCLRTRPGSEHSGNALLDIAMAEAGRLAGLRIAADGECATLLEYRILDLRIAYTGIDRSALGFKKEVARTGTCVIAARLIEAGSGTEIATTQQEMVLGDSFPYDIRDLLASSSYSFTAPELKERDWSKSVEPFVVTAMISGLIYLFFSNQSSE